MSLLRFAAVRPGHSQSQSAAHPNEPVGNVMLLTHDSSAVLPNAAWTFTSGQASIVTDAERGDCLQLRYQPITIPSSSNAQVNAEAAGLRSFAPTQLYIAYHEKISLGWIGNNSVGQCKNMFLEFQQHVGSYNTVLLVLVTNPLDDNSRVRPGYTIYEATDHDGNSYSPAVNVTYDVPDAGDPNDPGDLWPRGEWHFFETLITLPERGVANGVVKQWVDGFLLEPTNVTELFVNGLHATEWKLDYDSMPRWTGINIDNTWGGGGTPIAVDQYYRFKDFYISGGYARTGERPDHWVVSRKSGDATAVTAGASIPIQAQLFDENNNSVDIWNLNPANEFLTGHATRRYRVASPSTEADHGVQLYWLDIDGGAAPGDVITFAVSDDALTNNLADLVHHRGSNTLSLTVV